jgi:hypothetical protein
MASGGKYGGDFGLVVVLAIIGAVIGAVAVLLGGVALVIWLLSHLAWI